MGVVLVLAIIYVLYKLGLFNHSNACDPNDADCIY
jgi:hypothetical protein